MPKPTDHVADPPQHEQPDSWPRPAEPPAESNVVALRLEIRDRPPSLGFDLLVTIPALFAEPFWRPTGPALSAEDQRWFAELTTRWLRAGCPADLRVDFSAEEALQVLLKPGQETPPLEILRASLQRLRCCTVVSLRRRQPGGEEAAIWGLVERASIGGAVGAQRRCWAELSREVAELLQQASRAHLHAATWDRLRARDELASRLWAFLETQEMPTLGRRYDLFSAPPQGPARRRSLPALGRMAGLDDSLLRREAVDRVRRAARVVAEIDPRYAVEVLPTSPAGMWRLEVRRRRFHAPPGES